jgi:hypothetical protein
VIVADHIHKRHESYEKGLFDHLGGFWAAILKHLHITGTWRLISELLFELDPQTFVEVLPLDRAQADGLWRSGQMLTRAALGEVRLLPQSPCDRIFRGDFIPIRRTEPLIQRG